MKHLTLLFTAVPTHTFSQNFNFQRFNHPLLARLLDDKEVLDIKSSKISKS